MIDTVKEGKLLNS